MLSLAAAPTRWLAAWALFLCVAASSGPAQATPIVVDAGWASFAWTGGAGPIDTPSDGFQFTATGPVEVQITDCCVIGDQFEIFVNSISVGLTSAPVGSGPSGAFTGPASWADSRLSKISLFLGAGSYDIDITVTTSVISTGGGFIQVIPEPSARALLAVGIAGLLAATLVRTQRASTRPSPAKK